LPDICVNCFVKGEQLFKINKFYNLQISVCTLFLVSRVHIVQKRMRLRLFYRKIIGGNGTSYWSFIVFVSVNILYRSLDLCTGQLYCQGLIFYIFTLITEVLRSMSRTASRTNCDSVSNLLRFDPCSAIAWHRRFRRTSCFDLHGWMCPSWRYLRRMRV
jgi:sensor histidine kinase YesM